jgi:hypothetical protein
MSAYAAFTSLVGAFYGPRLSKRLLKRAQMALDDLYGDFLGDVDGAKETLHACLVRIIKAINDNTRANHLLSLPACIMKKIEQ